MRPSKSLTIVVFGAQRGDVSNENDTLTPLGDLFRDHNGSIFPFEASKTDHIPTGLLSLLALASLSPSGLQRSRPNSEGRGQT